MINSKIISPKLSDTIIGGATAKRAEVFFENRFFSDFAKNEIFREAEDVFANQVDDENPLFGVWQGEFWGKQILSAVEVYKYKKDEKLKETIINSAKRVISFAREDGYIGSYKDSKNVFADKNTEGSSSWNIWGRKYTLWGLIAVYEMTGDKEILCAAEKTASQLIGELYENDIDITETGMFCGMPSCSILKPMVLLYEHTGNMKYLDFSIKSIADKWEREDNTCPNLIKNALAQKKVADWYPDAKLWAKAYEMMSCYEGILELYRVTGEKKYFDAVSNFFDTITENEKNILGSVAFNDMFNNAGDAMNTLSEPCDSVHYMRLCYELYVLTEDIKYMHLFEGCYFNAFMAGLYHDWASRAVRSAGRHMWTNQAGMKYQHCCLNNMARAILRYSETAVVCNDEYVTVNFFEEFSAKLSYDGGSCTVKVSEGFFKNESVKVAVSFDGTPKKLRIRIPLWTDKCDFDVLGVQDSGTVKNGYFELSARSEAEIAINFNMMPKLSIFEGEPSDNEWHFNRWTSDYATVCTVPHELFLTEKKCTLTFGPLLLAKSKKIGLDEKDVFASGVSDKAKVTLERVENNDTYVTFKAKLEDTDGKVFETFVCDFASCANDRLDDDRYFSIYF